jgi:hypothetical protein
MRARVRSRFGESPFAQAAARCSSGGVFCAIVAGTIAQRDVEDAQATLEHAWDDSFVAEYRRCVPRGAVAQAA